MKTAKLLKDKLPDYNGHAALYALDPPMAGNNEGEWWRYVVVSAAVAKFGDIETCILPADKKGEVVEGCELPGSQRGTLSHEKALADAGYAVG